MNTDIKVKRFSLDFPIEISKQIDEICKNNFMSKRKWFIDASKEKLEREFNNRIDKIIRE